MKGKLKHWSEEKGFGFITSSEDPKDIFIHISALKKMSRRPIVGDIITFQVHVDNNGKKRATNAQIQGVASVNLKAKDNKKKVRAENNWLLNIVFLALLFAVGYGLYSNYFKQSPQVIVNNQPLTNIKKANITNEGNYSCEGKTHCSQMSSCAEARYYIKNCPETKMDGDNDGVPCERQLCN